nr:hypothetical protein [uncultured Cohaesibacter sp.]
MTVSRCKDIILSGAESLKSRSAQPSGFIALVMLGSLGLSGCSGISSTTYGTGETHERELLEDVTGLLGALPNEKKRNNIDYSARAGLVLPPEGTPLPTPEDGSKPLAYADANWPQDPDKLREIYNERMENMTDEERAQLLEAIRRLPPEQRDSIIKNNTASSEFARQIKEPDFSKGPVDPYEMKEYDKQVKQRLALIRSQKEGEKGKRTYLTQPPERFTDVTPEVASEMEKLKQEENGGKKKRFFSRLWPFGSKNED